MDKPTYEKFKRYCISKNYGTDKFIKSLYDYLDERKYGAASRKGMDASHTKSGIRYKPSSVNRGSKTDMAGDRRARGGR